MGLSSLVELNLAKNDLSNIHIQAFNSLARLKIARLNNNNLNLRTGIYDTFGNISPFHKCPVLEELYLAHNHVTEIQRDWIINNIKLKILDLRHNSFNYLQAEDLQFSSNKLTVRLGHNNITRVLLANLETLSQQAAINNLNNSQFIKRDIEVDLSENPIRCDCEVYDFLRFLNGDMHPSVYDYVYFNLNNLNCRTPENMAGTRVRNFYFYIILSLC